MNASIAEQLAKEYAKQQDVAHTQSLTSAQHLHRWSVGYLDMLKKESDKATDNVNHPKHYTSHPSGIEVIQITEHMNFCLGNAVKYILRADLKNNAIEDLKKAVWYLNREIERRTRANNS